MYAQHGQPQLLGIILESSHKKHRHLPHVKLRLSILQRYSDPFVESFASGSPFNVIWGVNGRGDMAHWRKLRPIIQMSRT